MTIYPEQKQEKWGRIDQKLAAKYGLIDQSKFQRYRARKKGYSAFSILRWNSTCLIFKTPGKVPSEITADDAFAKVKDRPVKIKVSDFVEIDIGLYGDKVTAKLSKDSYAGVKSYLETLVYRQEVDKAIQIFNRLNGLPATAGIIAQKRKLAAWLSKLIAKREKAEKQKQKEAEILKKLRIGTKRKIVTVFPDTENKTAKP